MSACACGHLEDHEEDFCAFRSAQRKVFALCLAVPGKLEEKQGRYGIVDFGGMRRKVDISLLERCTVGDYVIVHAGFAIEIMDEDDALVTLDIFKQIEAAME